MKCFTGLVLLVGLVWCQNENGRNAAFYNPDQPRGDPNRGFPPPPPPFPDHYHHHGPPHDHRHHSYHHSDTDQPYIEDSATLNYTIPLDVAFSLNDYIADDLMLNAIEDKPDDLTSISAAFALSSRIGENTERRTAQIARPAKCMPELTTVTIIQSNERNVVYMPECTRVERCGGCCSHDLLSCQPVESEPVIYSVVKTTYNEVQKRLQYVEKVPVTVDRHTKCKCQCKIKAENCTVYQEYRESECRCVCKNIDEEKKCYKNSGLKLWNPASCSCECRETQPCSTGFEFDFNECRCTQSQLRRRYILNAKEQPDS